MRGNLKRRALATRVRTERDLGNRWVCRGDAEHITYGDGCWLKWSARVQTLWGGEIRIGNGVRIGEGTLLQSYAGLIVLHDGVGIGPKCVLYGHGGLEIGEDTLIGPCNVIVPSNHIYTDRGRLIREQGETRKGIKIGRGVWIGSPVTVLDGVTVGDGSVIAAGAVVRLDVPPFSVVAGVPARVIGQRGPTANS